MAGAGGGVRQFRKLMAVTAAGLACAGLTATSARSAPAAEMVSGAGFSTNDGLVTIQARASTTSEIADATGSLAAFSPRYGSVRGTVTCIAQGGFGPWPGGGAAISGNLDSPIVLDGLTYTRFTFLLYPGGALQALFLGVNGGTLIDCGLPLFAAAGLPGDGFTDPAPFRVQTGNYVMR